MIVTRGFRSLSLEHPPFIYYFNFSIYFISNIFIRFLIWGTLLGQTWLLKFAIPKRYDLNLKLHLSACTFFFFLVHINLSTMEPTMFVVLNACEIAVDQVFFTICLNHYVIFFFVHFVASEFDPLVLDVSQIIFLVAWTFVVFRFGHNTFAAPDVFVSLQVGTYRWYDVDD